MLISHRYQFIYTKTAKTAGTSVESYFERFCMPDGEWTPYHLRDMYESEYGVIGYRGFKPHGKKWFNHMPASEIKRLVGSQIWDQYFKFCVIRNPWEKVISMFEAFGREHRLPAGRHGVVYHLKHRFHNSEQRRFLHWLETKGVAWDPSFLPKYKMGIRRKESTVSRLYRKPARRLVEKAFSFEISHFGYEFPE